MKFSRHSFLAAAVFASFAAVAPAAVPAAQRAERAERRLETRYLTSLIDEHALALQLAELAQTRATHEELQQLGATAETALTANLAQLQSWLQAWHGESHDGALDRRAERLVDQLAQLSGEEFETELIATLVDHHLGALREATRALRHAQRPELINQAALSVAAHADEIAQLRLWLEQWYGDGATDGDGSDGEEDATEDTNNGSTDVSTSTQVSTGAELRAGAAVNSPVTTPTANNGDGALNRAPGVARRNGE